MYDKESWYLAVVGNKVTRKYVGCRYILATTIDEVKRKSVLDQFGNKTDLDVLQVVYLGSYKPSPVDE